MDVEEAIEGFNLTIDEVYAKSFETKGMSYIIEGKSALVFDGDCGVMLVSYVTGVVTYALVECTFFEDFSDLLPEIIEKLKRE